MVRLEATPLPGSLRTDLKLLIAWVSKQLLRNPVQDGILVQPPLRRRILYPDEPRCHLANHNKLFVAVTRSEPTHMFQAKELLRDSQLLNFGLKAEYYSAFTFHRIYIRHYCLSVRF